MLVAALLFLQIALVSGIFGFVRLTEYSVDFTDFAKITFVVPLALVAISILVVLFRRRSPRT